jgi:hypothetical protein
MTGEPAKYFIALNKRSTPYTQYGVDDDSRELHLKFDASQLSVYRNWKLTNAVTNELIATFDKTSSNFVNAGLFMPAEVKLMKIAPVVQEDGTLVCDENVKAEENMFVFRNSR